MTALATPSGPRAKFYKLGETGEWDDCGTGLVALDTSDDGSCLKLTSETAPFLSFLKITLVPHAQQGRWFSMQGLTFIVWTNRSPGGKDCALSFEESAGCAAIATLLEAYSFHSQQEQPLTQRSSESSPSGGAQTSETQNPSATIDSILEALSRDPSLPQYEALVQHISSPSVLSTAAKRHTCAERIVASHCLSALPSHFQSCSASVHAAGCHATFSRLILCLISLQDVPLLSGLLQAHMRPLLRRLFDEHGRMAGRRYLDAVFPAFGNKPVLDSIRAIGLLSFLRESVFWKHLDDHAMQFLHGYLFVSHVELLHSLMADEFVSVVSATVTKLAPAASLSETSHLTPPSSSTTLSHVELTNERTSSMEDLPDSSSASVAVNDALTFPSDALLEMKGADSVVAQNPVHSLRLDTFDTTSTVAAVHESAVNQETLSDQYVASDREAAKNISPSSASSLLQDFLSCMQELTNLAKTCLDTVERSRFLHLFFTPPMWSLLFSNLSLPSAVDMLSIVSSMDSSLLKGVLVSQKEYLSYMSRQLSWELAEVWKRLLESESEDTHFLTTFYGRVLVQWCNDLFAQVQSIASSRVHQDTEMHWSAEHEMAVLDVLATCAEVHPSRMRYFMVREQIASHLYDVLSCWKCMTKPMVLAVVRVMKMLSTRKDAALDRMLTQAKLWEGVVQVLLDNRHAGGRYNMIHSMIMEMLQSLVLEKRSDVLVTLAKERGMLEAAFPGDPVVVSMREYVDNLEREEQERKANLNESLDLGLTAEESYEVPMSMEIDLGTAYKPVFHKRDRASLEADDVADLGVVSAEVADVDVGFGSKRARTESWLSESVMDEQV